MELLREVVKNILILRQPPGWFSSLGRAKDPHFLAAA
jgi:hypothetical protein